MVVVGALQSGHTSSFVRDRTGRTRNGSRALNAKETPPIWGTKRGFRGVGGPTGEEERSDPRAQSTAAVERVQWGPAAARALSLARAAVDLTQSVATRAKTHVNDVGPAPIRVLSV
jgi:hypothetical protein